MRILSLFRPSFLSLQMYLCLFLICFGYRVPKWRGGGGTIIGMLEEPPARLSIHILRFPAWLLSFFYIYCGFPHSYSVFFFLDCGFLHGYSVFFFLRYCGFLHGYSFFSSYTLLWFAARLLSFFFK